MGFNSGFKGLIHLNGSCGAHDPLALVVEDRRDRYWLLKL